MTVKCSDKVQIQPDGASREVSCYGALLVNAQTYRALASLLQYLHQFSPRISRKLCVFQFFLLQLRRKPFWIEHICDKNFATFLGRPPMINSKFCSRQIPLELEDMKLALNRPDYRNPLGSSMWTDGIRRDELTGRASFAR